MKKKYIFNKSKDPSIIFIHGLFANSGFWLKYISCFRDYKLILYNIDYEKLLDDLPFFDEIRKEFHLDYKINNVVGVVSHSLGTICSDLFFSNYNINLFNICPVALGNRTGSLEFINYTSYKLNLSKTIISNSLIKVDSFYSDVKDKLTLKGFNIIPDKDEYFIYDIPHTGPVVFEGNHFEISNAFDFIVSRLLLD